MSTTKKPGAWITSTKDKGRKSIREIDGKDTVYLNDSEEFLIELFNPLKFSILANISIDGKSISTSGAGIVLNPGQRYYLDCFLDNSRKLKFSTYDIENTQEVMDAISNNGLVEVLFYKESIKNIVRPYGGYKSPGVFTSQPDYSNNFFHSTNTGGVGTNFDNTFTTNSTSMSLLSLDLETGRVEKGSKSDQVFETIDMDFDNMPLSKVIIQMLPESRKPFEPLKDKYESLGTFEVIELLKQLKQIYDMGILSKEDFESKKIELLKKI